MGILRPQGSDVASCYPVMLGGKNDGNRASP